MAFDANPNTGFAVYDSVASGGQSGWFEIGGTSAGAPQWAALFAIADQGRALGGQSTIANGQSQLYKLSSSDFHDVTTGSNGNSARVGYDLVTGRGTPVANLVVADLVSGATSTTNSNPPTSTPTQPAPPTQHHYHVYYEIVYINGRYWIVEIITFSAVNASQPDDVSQGLAQVNTALADASSTANVPAANTASAANDSVGAPSSPTTPSLTTPTLAVAPQSDIAAGNSVATPDATGPQNSPNGPALDQNNPASDIPAESNGESPELQLPSIDAAMPAVGIDRMVYSTHFSFAPPRAWRGRVSGGQRLGRGTWRSLGGHPRYPGGKNRPGPAGVGSRPGHRRQRGPATRGRPTALGVQTASPIVPPRSRLTARVGRHPRFQSFGGTLRLAHPRGSVRVDRVSWEAVYCRVSRGSISGRRDSKNSGGGLRQPW